MSIFHRPRSTVNPKPSPVRSTVVLFDGGRRHRSPEFGRGILRSLPTYRTSFTAADLAWAAEAFNTTTALDRHLDELATESAMLDRYTAGTLPL